MQRTALKMAALALVVLFVTSATVLAADTMISGTVQTVNEKAGSFTLMTPNKKTQVLHAPATLLRDLKAGEHVKVTMHKKKVTNIQKTS